jgi:bifunctional DNA-binding transcriptional regulator/antitoxin component of YhaV-PrlF toxin-antitoxin module
MKSHGQVRSDDQGRLVLPLMVEKEFGLVPGSTLVVERTSADGLVLRIEDGEQRLLNQGGILVFDPDEVEPSAIASALEAVRTTRADELRSVES